jgi:hypothetical protein
MSTTMKVLIVILLCVPTAGLLLAMLYALKADGQLMRASWQATDKRQGRLQGLIFICWLVGLAVGFGIGYAVSANYQGGIAGVSLSPSGWR